MYTPLKLNPFEHYAHRFFCNPSGLSGIGDPFIRKDGNVYHCYSTGTGDEYKGTGKRDEEIKGFRGWRTDTLADWSKAHRVKFEAFTGSSWTYPNWYQGCYWGPEVHFYQGKYVMLFNAKYGEGKLEDGTLKIRLGIAFADSPEGPFTDPLGHPLLQVDYCCIDAHLFVDDDGTPYLFYARDNYDNWIGENQVSQIWGVQLAPDLLSPVGEPRMLTTPEHDWEKLTLEYSHYMWNEGVHVLKNQGKYHLFFCANYTSHYNYCYGVAVADSPLGPYVKPKENPLLAPMFDLKTGNVIASGPANGAFFTSGDEMFCSYHVNTDPIHPTMHRTLCIDRAGFHADGSAFINGPTLTPQLLPLCDIGMENAALKARIESDGKSAYLTDGDACVSAASEHYLWRGKDITMTWDTPVSADMILIHPLRGERGEGVMIINDRWEVPLHMYDNDMLPGFTRILAFDEMLISSIRIQWKRETALGEIVVLAKCGG